MQKIILAMAVAIIGVAGSSGMAAAGFLDQLLEEGKKKAQEEASKMLKPTPAPTRPERSAPSQGAGTDPSTQPSSSSNSQFPTTTTSSDSAGSQQLRNRNGALVINGSGYEMPRDLLLQYPNLVKQFIDRVTLGLIPEYFEQHALCFADNYLAGAERGKYLETGKVKGMIRDDALTPWKGNNEFEKPRSQQAFIEEYRSRFQSQAVQLPIKIAFYDAASYRPYNFQTQSFVLQFLIDNLNDWVDAAHWSKFLPGPGPQRSLSGVLKGYCSELAFGVPSPLAKGNSIEWKISPGEAEAFTNRVRPGAPAVVGMIFEFQKVSSSEPYSGVVLGKNRRDGTTYTEPIKSATFQATLKSLGWYEDPAWERPMAVFDGQSWTFAGSGKAKQEMPGSPAGTLKQESTATSSNLPAPTPVALSSSRIQLPKVKRISGRVAYSFDSAFQSFVDLIDLGLTPGLFEKGSGCYLMDQAPQSVAETYLSRAAVIEMIRVRDQRKQVGRPFTLAGLGLDGDPWKGNNQFEKARARQEFVRDYQNDFQVAAIKLPLELALVSKESLPPYDASQKTFPMFQGRSLPVHPKIFGVGHCGGLFIVGEPYTASKWSIEPTEAEKLLGRLPARTVYWGAIVELTPVSGSTCDSKKCSGPQEAATLYIDIPRPQLQARTKVMGLYEDPDLEQPIQIFEIGRASQ